MKKKQFRSQYSWKTNPTPIVIKQWPMTFSSHRSIGSRLIRLKNACDGALWRAVELAFDNDKSWSEIELWLSAHSACMCVCLLFDGPQLATDEHLTHTHAHIHVGDLGVIPAGWRLTKPETCVTNYDWLPCLACACVCVRRIMIFPTCVRVSPAGLRHSAHAFDEY